MTNRRPDNISVESLYGKQNWRGLAFWEWLAASIDNNSLAVNGEDSLVYTEKERYFIVSPAIFKHYNREQFGVYDDSFEQERAAFLQLGRHCLQEKGSSCLKVRLNAPIEKKGKFISGYLIESDHMQVSDAHRNSSTIDFLGKIKEFVPKKEKINRLGDDFWDWLMTSLDKNTLNVNARKSPVQMVDGYLFLVANTIFDRYCAERYVLKKTNKEQREVRAAFQRLNYHCLAEDKTPFFKVESNDVKCSRGMTGYVIKRECYSANENQKNNPDLTLTLDEYNPYQLDTETQPLEVEGKAGMVFWQWLINGIRDKKLIVNERKSGVHRIDGQLFLTSPLIFQIYSLETKRKKQDKKQWLKVQSGFKKLNKHCKSMNDRDIYQLSIVGSKTKKGRLSGFLLKENTVYLEEGVENDPNLSLIES